MARVLCATQTNHDDELMKSFFSRRGERKYRELCFDIGDGGKKGAAGGFKLEIRWAHVIPFFLLCQSILLAFFLYRWRSSSFSLFFPFDGERDYHDGKGNMGYTEGSLFLLISCVFFGHSLVMMCLCVCAFFSSILILCFFCTHEVLYFVPLLLHHSLPPLRGGILAAVDGT